MSSVSKISKIFLVVQGLILIFPSLFSFSIFLDQVVIKNSPASSDQILKVIVAFLGLLYLCIFWYLFFIAVFEVYSNREKLPVAFRFIALVGAVNGLISWILVKNLHGFESLAVYGIDLLMFAPTYLYSIYEINIQKDSF